MRPATIATITPVACMPWHARGCFEDGPVQGGTCRYCSRSIAVRWSPFPGQICGFAKLGSGPCHAANLIPTGAPWWASAGVRPPSAECGRSAL